MSTPTSDEMRGWYEQYGFVLYRRCYRILGDEEEARDAVQEIFVQAWRARASYLREAPPLHWLQRITTRHCLKHLRSRRLPSAPEHELARLASADDPARQAGRRQLVTRLLSHFDERTQAAAVAIHVEGLLQEEAAEALGISSRALRKRLTRFRDKAQRLLDRWQRQGAGGGSA